MPVPPSPSNLQFRAPCPRTIWRPRCSLPGTYLIGDALRMSSMSSARRAVIASAHRNWASGAPRLRRGSRKTPASTWAPLVVSRARPTLVLGSGRARRKSPPVAPEIHARRISGSDNGNGKAESPGLPISFSRADRYRLPVSSQSQIYSSTCSARWSGAGRFTLISFL